ncbi:MAG TPA: TIGR03668 family PPOX class F420-dependent oxidoreductase [Candidatus Limnocylindrales bacterium]|nr:TIGR03668 family PPOX class F420-dependent oxidoreductase [Candidatus Limnocylindrales bacterium]
MADLTDGDRDVLSASRTAVLATIAPDGRPRLVPVCFVAIDDVIWTPIDEKPKAVDDPRALARVRDIARDPRVTLLVDRWSEDWTELVWVRLEGQAEVVQTADQRIIARLRAKYRQYAEHDLESSPMIRITIERVVGWDASATQANASRRPVE